MLLNKIRSAIISKYFLWGIFIFFAAQGIFYSTTSRYGLPPDEKFHFESIQYYTKLPLENGPFINNQPTETIKAVDIIGDSSSYLYHYLLSFPVRVMNKLSVSRSTQIVMLRLINVIFGITTLLVFRKVLDVLSDNKVLKNLSVAALSVTGIFVFLSAALNYDNLANLFFIAFVLNGIYAIKRINITPYIWAVVFGLAASITKFTLLPVISIGMIIITATLIKEYGLHLLKYRDSLKKQYELNKFLTVLCITLLIIISFLFAERIGGNLIRYGQISPSCDKIFEIEQCLKNPIYKRDINLKESFQKAGGVSSLTGFNLFTHTGAWINTMYNGLFYYYGHSKLRTDKIGMLLSFIVFMAIIVTLLLPRKRIRLKPEHLFVLAITLLYISILYLFNLKTFLSLGARVAYQGRYLLPVLGLLYFFTGLIVYSTYKNMPKFQNTFLTIWIMLLVFGTIVHIPLRVFYIYSVDAKNTPYRIELFNVKYRER